MEKYAFGDIIGHGNYGTCHVVTHLKENRRYVAKRIPVHDVAARGEALAEAQLLSKICLLYTSPSPRDGLLSRMPSSA